MRRLVCVALFALGLSMPALAGSGMASLPGAPAGCAEFSIAAAGPRAPTIHLAQSSCRSECSSRRGYCMSSCRDGQCRAICNDLCQSCISSCR